MNILHPGPLPAGGALSPENDEDSSDGAAAGTTAHDPTATIAEIAHDAATLAAALSTGGNGHAEFTAAYGGDGTIVTSGTAAAIATVPPAAATVADLTTIRYAGDVRVDSLQDSPVAWNFLLPTRNVLYYTFDASAGSPIAADAGEPVAAFNAMQKDAARHILADAAALTGISFVEVASGAQADIAFANHDLGGTDAGITHGGYTYWYGTGNVLTAVSAYAHVFIDDVAAAAYNAVPTPGSAGYEVLLHEIGHALGLGHPFDAPSPLPAAQDNTGNTVMSYTDVGGYKSTFQAFDRLALEWIYGGDGIGAQWGYNSSYGPSLSPFALITGTAGDDEIAARAGGGIVDGAGGRDTVVFSNPLAAYSIVRSGDIVTVTDQTAGRDGTYTLAGVESLRFPDFAVNLTVQACAADGITPAAAHRLEELYVAFFNRTPDADGLEYWIGRYKAGASIDQIAESFYQAGIQYSSLTGFSASMTDKDFVDTVYRNVLGRRDGADPGGLSYWTEQLAHGTATHGSLTQQILNSAHTFKGDATWGWVANLLDNKVAVADTVAVSFGLTYHTPQDAIVHGMAIAAAVTPTDIAPAIALVGVNPAELQLAV